MRFYKNFVSSCIVFCFTINLGVLALESHNTTYEMIASQYLPSLAAREALDLHNQVKDKKAIVEAFRKNKYNVSLPQLGDTEKMRLLYKLFALADQEAQPSIQKQHVADFFKNINMFCGKENDVTAHLFKHIDKTHTTAGKIELQKMLAEPLCDIAELTRRQSAVKTLVENQELFDQLSERMNQLADAESAMLWFFKESDLLSEECIDTAYFKNKFFKRFNHNATMLEANKLCTQLLSPAMSFALPFIISFGIMALNEITDGKTPSLKKEYKALKKVLTGGDGNEPQIITLGLFGTCILGALYFTLPKAIKSQKTYNLIHEKMIPAALYVDTLKSIGDLVSEHEALAAFASTLQTTAEPEKVKKLFTLLEKPTFQGSPSFFSHQGRALAAFKIMQLVKDNMVASIKTIGQLDAYLSLAKLYKTHTGNTQTPFCFAEFIDDEKPRVIIENFWMLGTSKEPLLSSINLDTKTQGSLITAGPNQEKTAVITNLTLALLLAQTCGIAPAKTLIITPFSMLLPAITPAHSFTTQTSCEAAIDRSLSILSAAQNLRTSQSLSKNERGIVLLNEPFAGAEYKTALAGTYALVKEIVQTTECLCVCSSFMPELTALENATGGLVKQVS